jgi:hypothetical protein
MWVLMAHFGYYSFIKTVRFFFLCKEGSPRASIKPIHMNINLPTFNPKPVVHTQGRGGAGGGPIDERKLFTDVFTTSEE